MSDTRDFAQLLQNATTRAIQPPVSRNRPITLFIIGTEMLELTQDTADLTTHIASDITWWDATGSSSQHGFWGQAEWR